MESQETEKPQLPEFVNLARESMHVYKKKWPTLLQIALLQSAISFLAAMIIGVALVAGGVIFVGSLFAPQISLPHFDFIKPLFILVAALAVAGGALLNSWMSASMIVVLRDSQENVGLGGALARGRRHVLSYLWAVILGSLAMIAGYFLLIIPGIVMGIWFMFAGYIVVAENERGMTALLKSRAYVRGYFWQVFLLSLLINFSLLFIDSALKIFGSSALGSFIQAAGSILVVPLMPIYIFLLYGSLRNAKGESPSIAILSQKIYYFMAGAGLVLLIGIISLLINYSPQINNAIQQEILKQQNSLPPTMPLKSI